MAEGLKCVTIVKNTVFCVIVLFLFNVWRL